MNGKRPAVVWARLSGLTQWLRPVAAVSSAQMAEPMRTPSHVPSVKGAPRTEDATISAALSTRGAASAVGLVRPGAPAGTEAPDADALDETHDKTGAPYSAASEGARAAATRQEPAVDDQQAHVCYVYGIVHACTSLPEGLLGTGGVQVRLVRHGALAGVISEVPPTGALGTREELLAHESVVASLAARTTMLPLRFSAVVTTAEAVVKEMLEPYYDWFTGVLSELEGRAAFSVSGTYVQDTVLREVLAEEPEVMRLRESLRGLPEDTEYYERVRLGELIVQALDAKREVDTEELVHTLSQHAVAVAERPPVDEDTAADAAFLVADGDRADFRKAVDELGYRWAGRIRLRVLGPLPPYDFVPSPPGGPFG
jgi:hypothetical protein